MRGKDFVLLPRSRFAGITPAYAGKSFTRQGSLTLDPDHPRVCGEKVVYSVCKEIAPGSPPRMRGKGHLTLAVSHMHRINPAYTGKSTLPHHRAHFAMGSPPRMRGKGRCHHSVVFVDGITPAHAGKRLKRSRSTVSPIAIVPLFPSVCNKPVVSNGNLAGRDAPLFLPAENAAAAPAGPAGSCPASRPSQFPPRIMVISPRP